MTLMDRRRALMEQGEIEDKNLVESFTPVTRSFTIYDNIAVPLTEVIQKEKAYRVVLDATVPSGYRFLVLLGARNNLITYFPEGQDGIEEETWTTNLSGDETTANAYIYCRPVHGTGAVTVTIRNIKVYRYGW